MMQRAAALLILFSILAPVSAHAQYAGTRMADLEQDVMAVKSQLGELRMAIEALQRENQQLRSALASQSRGNQQGYATIQQVDAALQSLRQELLNADSQQKREIITEVTRQIDRLASQTQNALQAMSGAISAAPQTATNITTSFSDDFPKDGIVYIVKSGDTLSGIAKRNNSTVRDIQNANKISDPTRIIVGQTLFIPQAK